MLKNYPASPKHASILYMLFFIFFTLTLVSFSALSGHCSQPASSAFSPESSRKFLPQNPVQNAVKNLERSSSQNSSQNSGLFYAQNSGSSTEGTSSQTGLSSWPPRSDSQKQEKRAVQAIRESARQDGASPVQAESDAQDSSELRVQPGQLGSSSYANKDSSADESTQPLSEDANSTFAYDSEQKASSSELAGRSGRTLLKDSPQAGGSVPVITPSTAFKDAPGGSINGTMGMSASEVPISSWSANATRALLRYTDTAPAPGSESMPQLIPLGE